MAFLLYHILHMTGFILTGLHNLNIFKVLVFKINQRSELGALRHEWISSVRVWPCNDDLQTLR